MALSVVLRLICALVFALCLTEAFVGCIRPSLPTATLLTSSRPDSTSRTLLKTTRTPKSCNARAPVSSALRMAEYDGGPSEDLGEPLMEMQELIVDFTDDGRILLEVKGVKGQECRQITEDLIKALGDEIHTENTAEYFEERVVNKNINKENVNLGWSYDANKPEW